MTADITITVDKHDEVPSGIVLIEDVASLSGGLIDAVLRLIQLGLGYPHERIREETKKLAKIGLNAVKDGSGVLEYTSLPIENYNGRHPAVIATSEIIKGVNYYTENGKWPEYLPSTIRYSLGASIAPIAKEAHFVKLSVNENGTPLACSINHQISNALMEFESIVVDEPIQIVGKIYNINIDTKTAKIDSSLKRVAVELDEKWFNTADELRWKRVFLVGLPQDDKCNRVKDIEVFRAATEDEEDGISTSCEITPADQSPNFRELQKRISVFYNYNKNWDSYDAEAPSKTLLDFGLSFIRDAFNVLGQHGIDIPETFVVPTKQGGLQYEWEISNRILELELSGKNDFKYLKIEGDSEEEGSAIRWQALRLIRWVATGEKI